MTYAFSDGLIASEGGFWGLENYARYDYKILPDVGTHKKAQNQKNLDITGPVCKLLTKIAKKERILVCNF